MGTSSISFRHTQTDDDIRQLIWFLTTCATFTSDGQYFTVSGALPLSYYSTPGYWGDYICNVWAGRNGADCSVVVKDHGGAGQPYYRNGEGSPGAQLQLERWTQPLERISTMPPAGRSRSRSPPAKDSATAAFNRLCFFPSLPIPPGASAPTCKPFARTRTLFFTAIPNRSPTHAWRTPSAW